MSVVNTNLSKTVALNRTIKGEIPDINFSPQSQPPTVAPPPETPSSGEIFTLTVSISGAPPTPPPTPTGITSWVAGATVNLDTAPTISGFTFSQWSGDTSTIADVNNPSTTIGMDGPKNVIADYV